MGVKVGLLKQCFAHYPSYRKFIYTFSFSCFYPRISEQGNLIGLVSMYIRESALALSI